MDVCYVQLYACICIYVCMHACTYVRMAAGELICALYTHLNDLKDDSYTCSCMYLVTI